MRRLFRAGGVSALLLVSLLCLPMSSEPAAAAVTREPGSFVALSPARVLDTRNGTGAPKTRVQPHATVMLQVAGRGGVPSAGAGAAVLNVTAVGPDAAGYVTAYPDDGSDLPLASNLSFTPGLTISGHVTVKLGGNGQIKLFNGSDGAVDLAADVSGWYVDGDASAAGTFTSMSPVRVLDTRRDQPISANGEVSVPMTGVVGSSNVAATVMNLTATNPAADGFITAYPGPSRPLASNVNFARGQTIPNAGTPGVGSDGSVRFYNGAGGTVDLVADVAGWFRSDGATGVPGSFTSMTPTRLLDTRYGTGAPQARVGAGKSVSFTVPSGAGAVSLDVTAINPGADGFITAFPAGTAPPLAANITFARGQNITNHVTVKVGCAGKVTLYNGSSSTVDLAADIDGSYRSNAARSGPPAAVLSNDPASWNWKLALPIAGTDGFAAQISQPALATYQHDQFFHINDAGDGVVFRAPVEGATTSGSEYPRTELREMKNNGKDEAGWSSGTGEHVMIICQAITATPPVKPHVVAGQIHSSSNDVMEIRLEGKRLFVESNGTERGNLDTNYTLGTVFTVEVRANAAGITVAYNGSPKVAYTKTGSGWYFKAGSYPQSNLSKGDQAGSYGEVVIYSLSVQHS
ncbi:MAG: polysaccharide lyase family 7 protein [Aeromicrobium sp.]